MGGLERGGDEMREGDKGADRQSESAKFRQTHLRTHTGSREKVRRGLMAVLDR